MMRVNSSRLNRLERSLRSQLSPQSDLIGATVTLDGCIRRVLTNKGTFLPPPPGLTLADLPADCPVWRYDPTQESVLLYRDEGTGEAQAQRALGVNEDVILGLVEESNAN